MLTLPSIPDEFVAASSQLGDDPMLVQGAGGNTSCKQDGIMWVKASGALLSRACSDDVFAAVDVSSVLAEIDNGGDGSCCDSLVYSEQGLRPSIETTFHALLPQRFVFHYHSVRSLAHSISIEGRQSLPEKLSGLDWLSVPYARPGLPLTKAIRSSYIDNPASVFLLQNHGVIVAGEDCADILRTIADIESRLTLPKRHTDCSAVVVESLAGWVCCSEASKLALDKTMLSRATAGSYYPDHVVFLGPSLDTADASQLDSSRSKFGVAVLVPKVGAYLREDASPANTAMLICLSEILSMIPNDWKLEPIGHAAEKELIGWDAEKYRQKLTG